MRSTSGGAMEQVTGCASMRSANRCAGLVSGGPCCSRADSVGLNSTY